MKKYGFRKFNNGWRFKVGGTSGEPMGIALRYFNKCGFRGEQSIKIEHSAV